MRRGQHTSKVLEAMRVPGLETPDEVKARKSPGQRRADGGGDGV